MEKILLLALAEILNIVLIKEEYIRRNRWLHKVNYGFATLSLIYFTITNSLMNAHNIIFLTLEALDNYLHKYSTLSFALSCLLLILSLNVVLPSVMSVQLRYNQYKNKIQAKSKFNLKIYAGISLIVYEILVVPLVLFLISYLTINNWILYLTNILLALSLTLAFRLNILYKECFFVIILLAHIFSTQIICLCLIVISVFVMIKRDSQMFFYVQVLVFSLIMLINASFNVDITILHLIILPISMAAIVLAMPKQYQYLYSDFNQILLKAIHKIDQGETLTRSQQRSIYAIVYYVIAEKDNYKLQIKNQQLQSIFQQISKDNVACLLKNKIQLDRTINPNNLLLQIQLAQAEIITNSFSIGLLTKIQAVNQAVEQKGDFVLRLRMTKLIHQLQYEYLAKDQKISPTTIILIQKSIEAFYHKIDQVQTLYSSIWKEQTRRCFQTIFIKKISKLCKAQSQCFQLLKSINKHKDARLQNLVYNSIQKRFSLSEAYQFPISKPQRYLQFQSTKFILIYDEQIVDVSQQFAYQIQTKRQVLINSSIFTIIPQIFHKYFKTNINNWLNNDNKDNKFIIPFKPTHNQCIFVPYICSFKIFAQIEGGIKYLIHIQKGYQAKVEYFLMYSVGADKIIMLSKTFCEQYKTIQQVNKKDQFSFSAEQLLGIDLTFLKDHSKQNSHQQILCQINQKPFQRKIGLKKIDRHRFFNLKLTQVYDLQNDRLLLLSITPKHQSQRSRTINEFILNQNLKLTTYMNKSDDKDHENNQNKTFCLIKNPLKEVIEQRINKKNSFLHNSYLLRSTVICITIVLLGLGAYLQFNGIVTNAVNGLQNSMNNYVAKLSNYQSIYLLFYQYYIYIHSLKHPQHFLEVSPNINISKLQKSYASKVTKSVNTLLGKSLDKSQQFNPTSYSLDYGSYEIISQIQIMSLLPLLQDIKYSVTTNQFLFTIQNSQIVDLYINSILPIDTDIIRSTITLQFYIFAAAFAFLLIIIIILKIQYLKIRYIIRDLLDIYAELTEETIAQQLQSLRKFKLLLNGDKNKIQQASCTLGLNQHRQIIKQSNFALIVNNNLFMIIVIVASAFLYCYSYYQLNTYRRDIVEVANYAASIQNISKTNTQACQRFYQVAIQELLPVNLRLQIQQINNLFLPNIDSSSLPSYFDAYVLQSAETMKIAICDSPNLVLKINNDLMLSQMNCSNVMFSELKNGFFQAFPFVLGEVNKHVGDLMSQLNAKADSQSIYPFFAQVIYSRKAIDLIIQMLNAQFKNTVSSFLQQRSNSFDSILALALLTMLCIVISSCLYLWHIANLCKIAKKAFNLLPIKFIYGIKASKALIKSGMLSKIQMVTI